VNLPKGSGLEQLSRILSPVIEKYAKAAKKRGKFMLMPPKLVLPVKKYTNKKPATKKRTTGLTAFSTNPLQSLLKGVTSVISQVTGKPEAEDYKTVVKSFIPGDARLLKPQYPKRSQAIQPADLDRDARDELIATYEYNNAVRTLILKKQAEHWSKVTEIDHPEHNGINFRNIADIAGDGKMQLLIGLTAKGRKNTIYGYSIGENTAKKLFGRDYHWVETANLPKTGGKSSKPHLAVWNRDENGMYDIEVLHWNGLQLEPAANTIPYYTNRVVPYYLRKVKQNRNSINAWYSLANSLKKAEAYRDALIIANAGTRLDNEPVLQDRFFVLKNEINDLLQAP